MVAVEPHSDGGHAQVAVDAPGVDSGDDGAAQRVQQQPGLGASLRGFERHGVGDALGAVAVGHGADVPSGQGVLAQPFPCLLLDLQPEVLGDALLDPADQDGGGADVGHVGGLVGGEQRHAPVLQLAFEFERVEGVAAGPLDVFADHDAERGLGAGGFFQEFGHAAVARQPGGGERGVAGGL